VAIVASTGDVALAAGATTETGGPFPGAEDFAVGSVTVTPVEADVASVEADVASVEADVASVEADVASVEADVASVEADVASVEADVASVEADVASAEADVASVEEDVALAEADVASVEEDVASAEADVAPVEEDVASAEEEAEAVPMVVGAGRLHPQLEALAADGICCRPLRFRSRGAATSCGPRRASRGIGRVNPVLPFLIIRFGPT
jgi:chromosome segregation ATPase